MLLSEYGGYTVKTLLQLPLSSIRKLATSILKRKVLEIRRQADIIRVAQHADKNDYQEFVNALDVDKKAAEKTSDDGSINTKFFGVVNG